METQETRQGLNRQLIKCAHGIASNESCWWCETTKNQPLVERIDVLEKRMLALLQVIQLLIKAPHLQGSNGAVVSNVVNNIIQGTENSLIQAGLDADKPETTSLAFWMSTDTDVIYQRRDGAWVDISFSHPTAPDIQITDVSIDDATGALQITTPD